MRIIKKINIVLLLHLSFLANSQNWIGYGKGSAFLKIENGIANSSTCDNTFNFTCSNLNPGLNQAIFKDFDSNEVKFWLWIDVMGPNQDSIKLKAQNGNTIFTFYNEVTHPLKSKYRSKSLIYEIYNHNDFLISRYEIVNTRELFVLDSNRNKSNTITFTNTQSQNLNSILSKIDVLSLNDCYGNILSPHETKYSFTFTDWDLKKYNYVSQNIPYYLDKVKTFIEEVENNHH